MGDCTLSLTTHYMVATTNVSKEMSGVTWYVQSTLEDS